MDGTSVKKFFDAWSVYGQILEHNYMSHRELYQDVNQLLARQFRDRAIKVLDLGCGSAYHFAQILQNRNVAYYRGYDLSEVAIAQAQQNLAPLHTQLDFYQGDLLTGLQENIDTFDLIFCSFALHHFSLAEKAEFFSYAFKRLKFSGILVLIDVMRDEREDREQYYEHYVNRIQKEWTAIAPEDKAALSEHIRSSDFPETALSLCAMADQAGFASGREISHYNWHRAWYFEKG